MTLRWYALALVAGCYSPSGEPRCSISCALNECPIGLSCGSDGLCFSGTACNELPDAGKQIDAPDDGCPGLGFVHFCPMTPRADMDLGGVTITTTSSADCTEMRPLVGGELACVYAADKIEISGRLTVNGTNPLVLIGLDGLTIEETGDIVVTAAANLSICGAPPDGGDQLAPGDGAAGGAGGTMAGLGGTGGAKVDSGARTDPNPALSLQNHLRGGCPGGSGGGNLDGSGGAVGGLGGGAIYLMSRETIAVQGHVFAQGSGGFGAQGLSGSPGGGGGGGSGGMIILDAPSIQLFDGGVLLAAGGGGGAGGRNNVPAMPSQHGSTATALSTSAPLGGVPNNCQDCAGGGSGGFDAINGGAGGSPTINNAGAGGGGGAAGLIRFYTQGPMPMGAGVHPPAT